MNAQKTRKFFIMRHGERLDYAFKDWIPKCFDKSGNYNPTDLNMPESVPERPRGYAGYAEDPPLTRIGLYQSQLTGEAFKKAQLDVSHVYCSPTLRCIQTCDAFLKGCNKKDEIKIKVEPGLYEWWAFFGDSLPDWLTPKELVELGYNIDVEYEPFLSIDQLGSKKETCSEYYSRSFSVTKRAINAHFNDNVLFVAHASSIEVCSRELMGKNPRNLLDLRDLLTLPYCAFIEIRQKGHKWDLEGRPFLQFSHASNSVFDYNKLF